MLKLTVIQGFDWLLIAAIIKNSIGGYFVIPGAHVTMSITNIMSYMQ